MSDKTPQAQTPARLPGRESPEHRTWWRIKLRCHDPKNSGYGKYGAKGITVCERWRNSFAAFYADMGPRPPNHSIDRIDNSKGYEPGNCRWATPKQQQNNRTNNRLVVYRGQTMTFAEALQASGNIVTRAVAEKRIDKWGWAAELAFEMPPQAPEVVGRKRWAPKGAAGSRS